MNPTAAQRLADAAQRLMPVTETPRLDAEILLAHAAGMPRRALLARMHEALPAPKFEALLARRLQFEPIAYIVGTWEFFSLEFAVRPPILVPRPETEHLVEMALEYLRGHGAADAPPRVLDLCTGAGCVAIAIARNASCAMSATDINPDAVALARENAARHKVRLDAFTGDLFDALPEGAPPFDCIVSNPPYVEEDVWPELSPVIRMHEDPLALLAGKDGLAIIRRIIAHAPRFLRPGGLLALEIGENHFQAAAALLRAAAFTDIACRHDLAGIPRIIGGIRP